MTHSPEDYPVIDHIRAANPPESVDPDNPWTRNPILAGNGMLSVQASSRHFCSPEVDGLDIAEYDTVEVMVLWGEPGSPCYHSVTEHRPDHGLLIWWEFEDFRVFPDDPPGTVLTMGWADVQRLTDMMSSVSQRGWEFARPVMHT